MKTKKTKSELTSNQYYGGLNRRFDNRYFRLKKLGFKYTKYSEFMAFVRKSPFNQTKEQVILASSVLLADNRYFQDELKRNLMRGG